jgi:hypothetical protein
VEAVDAPWKNKGNSQMDNTGRHFSFYPHVCVKGIVEGFPAVIRL